MLLAAGHGERMEPLSSWVPKPALDVLGRPLLACALDQLVAAGCDPLVVNTHRHAARLEEAVRAAAPSGHGAVRLSPEPELLGSAGGISRARPLFSAGGVLAANADVWSDLDLAPLLAAERDDAVVLGLVPHPDPQRWTSVRLEEDGTVSGFVPAAGPADARAFLFTGFQLLGSGVVASLPAPPAEMPAVWRGLLRRGSLRGVVLTGSWREAGTPLAYYELVRSLLSGRAWAHARAAVDPSARLAGSAVSAGCHVGAGAVLDGCVVTAGATVGPGCVLHDCLVFGPVTLGAGASWRRRILLPGFEAPLGD